MELEFNDIQKHRQGWDLKRGTTITNKLTEETHSVMYTIHHDTSVHYQSFAKAEVWSPHTLSWNVLMTFHYNAWAEDRESGMEGVPTGGMYYALTELEARAHAILNP